MAETELKLRVSHFTDKPGIYQMLNQQGEVVYVGKAKNLRKRLQSYFRTNQDPKTKALLCQVQDIKVIVLKTEWDAFLLENELIKKYQPFYNLRLKDDKAFPYLNITYEEKFPRLIITREKKEQGVYFGPYQSSKALRQIQKVINYYFPLRTCGQKLPRRACLQYHLKNCAAPCENKISPKEYLSLVKGVEQFLQGNHKKLKAIFQQKMKRASQAQNYERAAWYRDQLQKLNELTSATVITSLKRNTDIFAKRVTNLRGIVFILQVRNGKLAGDAVLDFKVPYLPEEYTLLERAILDYYAQQTSCPQKIIVREKLPHKNFIEKWFSTEKKCKVKIMQPVQQAEKQFMHLARNNAFYYGEHNAGTDKTAARESALNALQKLTNSPQLPLIVEAFDVSHLHGRDTVAGMVRFKNGLPDKKGYRRFIIKTTARGDDLRALSEAIERRYARLLKEKKILPDVILVDGGKTQLAAVRRSCAKLSLLDNIKLLALAKKEENIFIPWQKQAIILSPRSSLLKLLQHIRDEAHRFAHTFQGKRHTKKILINRSKYRT